MCSYETRELACAEGGHYKPHTFLLSATGGGSAVMAVTGARDGGTWLSLGQRICFNQGKTQP